MPRHTNDTYNVDIPSRPELVSIEDALESLADLASRRDALRLMAERAGQEAQRIDTELSRQFAAHERELRSLAARVLDGSGQ